MPRRPRGWLIYSSTLSLTSAIHGGRCSTSRADRFIPGKTRYPLYRGFGGPQVRSGRVRQISPPTGIQSPDRPARSEWLYLLSYPGPHSCLFIVKFPFRKWCLGNNTICYVGLLLLFKYILVRHQNFQIGRVINLVDVFLR